MKTTSTSIVLKRIVGSSDVDGAVLRLSFSIDSELQKAAAASPSCRSGVWSRFAMEDVTTLVNAMVKILKKRRTCMTLDEMVGAVETLHLFPGRVPSKELMESALPLMKRFREIPEGWGLTDWRFVRPRSIRDKVEIILKKTGQPLHFMEIANRIREAKFDHKTSPSRLSITSSSAIRSSSSSAAASMLCVSGGYEPGTVADVIERIPRRKAR